MQELMRNLKTVTDSSEVFGHESMVNLVGFENNRLKSLNTLNANGAAIRAVVDGKIGQCIASDLRHPHQLAHKIKTLAEFGDPVSFDFCAPGDYPSLQLTDPEVVSMDIGQIVQDGKDAIAVLNDYDPNVMCKFIAERSLDKVHVLTSAGTDVSYDRMFYSFGVLVELVEGKNILRMTRYAKGISKTRPSTEVAQDLVRYLKIGRNNVPHPSGKMKVLFSPASLADVLMAFTGSVDGDLAARGVSPLAKRMGEQVLDPRITIWDDPWHPNGIMSAPCDDEGTPTLRKAIIDKGVLRSYIADRQAAAKLGIPPTGNGFRAIPFERYKSFSVSIATDFSNFVLDPGPTPIEKLRSQIDYGIEVHQINGILLGDLIGGDFSGSLEIAFLIRDGERVGRVKNSMIAGNFFKLFKDQVIDLSREQEWGGTFGGCSGSFLLPWVCLDGVDISGTD